MIYQIVPESINSLSVYWTGAKSKSPLIAAMPLSRSASFECLRRQVDCATHSTESNEKFVASLFSRLATRGNNVSIYSIAHKSLGPLGQGVHSLETILRREQFTSICSLTAKVSLEVLVVNVAYIDRGPIGPHLERASLSEKA